MPAPKQSLRKPAYWQQFEDLCKRLWGEVWQCPEIKKNGRSGQTQHGVDVYGVPKEEQAYCGIQCKGKDDYADSVLTPDEIDTEIVKALLFSPPLKKFYFATTANKDASIEAYVRAKDIESRASGGFEIHLFCWEDIVDLIDQHRSTHDWYVRNIDHTALREVEVTFEEGETHKAYRPLLLRNHVTYEYLEPDLGPSSLMYGSPAKEQRNTRIDIETEPQPDRYFINGHSRRKGSCVFLLRITNTGPSVIEHFKLEFDIVSKGLRCDTVNKATSFADSLQAHTYDTWIDKDGSNGLFKPRQERLVQKDTCLSDALCVLPTVEEEQEARIVWRLLSQDFNAEGELHLQIAPRIIEEHSVEHYEAYFPNEIRLENYSGPDPDGTDEDEADE